jgi:hypothetical protein
MSDMATGAWFRLPAKAAINRFRAIRHTHELFRPHGYVSSNMTNSTARMHTEAILFGAQKQC